MQIDKKTLRYILFGAIGCILLYWLLNETERVNAVVSVVSGVLSPFFIGSVLAFIVNVPMRAFEKVLKGVTNTTLRRTIAIVLTLYPS